MNTSIFDSYNGAPDVFIGIDRERIPEKSRNKNRLSPLSNFSKNDRKKCYPRDYIPKNTDVIVGKGVSCYNHIGNHKLRIHVASMVSDYSGTTRRKEKSHAVSSIVKHVQRNGGAFIKNDQETGLWYDAEPFLVRDKISQILRNQNKNGNHATNQFKHMMRFNSAPISSACDNASIKQIYKVDVEKSKSPQTVEKEMAFQTQTLFQPQSQHKTEQKEELEFLTNNVITQSRSLSNADSSSDKELSDFFERYAAFIPDDVVTRDKNPLEPLPIQEFVQIKKK